MKKRLDSIHSTRNVLREAIRKDDSNLLKDLLEKDPSGVSDQDEVFLFLILLINLLE